MIEVDEIILQWALRYALGRQTYAPGTVQQAVRGNLNNFSRNFLTIAIRDIDEAERIAKSDLDIPALGNPAVDAPAWLKLRDEMRLKS